MRGMRGVALLLVLSSACAVSIGATQQSETAKNSYIALVELSQDEEPSPAEELVEDIADAAGNLTASNPEPTPDPNWWKPLIDPLIHTCPMDCNYRGVCKTGYCECTYPYHGKACEKELCGLGQHCSHHGLCVNNTFEEEPSHLCLCDDGWTGNDCSSQDEECPYSCLGHGACLKGVCSCRKGWKGDYCEEYTCPKDCSGHGECLLMGELGGRCNCSGAWYTESCEFTLCPRNCSGNGVCDIRTGACACNATTAGDACELRLCPNNCTFPRGVCDFSTGACRCAANRVGYDCSDDLCPNLCSGHGECQETSDCVCDPKWAGADCNTDLCSHNCSLHGICAYDGSCLCNYNFTGEFCEIDIRCPNNCSGHGRCDEAMCNCTQGWSSHDCSVAPFRCPEDYQCVHGNCSNGACACHRGWRDYDCSLEVVHMCSHNSECYHGFCDDLGQCVCEDNWTGVFCERYMAHPLPLRGSIYDLPDPLSLDPPSELEAKIRGFEKKYVGGGCGRFGGPRCASELYRRPNPRYPDTKVPMGIRHTGNRAKENATHTANGTFKGDIWGNATAMREEIQAQEEAAAEAAAEAAEAEAEKKDAEADAASEGGEGEGVGAETEPAPEGDGAQGGATKRAHFAAHVQTHHERNVQMARKHYERAQRRHREMNHLPAHNHPKS